MIWRSKFRFEIVIWRVSNKYSIQNTLLKLWSLKPATCTQPAQLWLSETNCCCHLLPGFVNVNWPVPLWLPVILEFISVPRHSASSFNSNTVRSCEKWPQFGWVWSNLHCWMHNMDAQVSGLLSVCLLNEVAFSRNLENWYLPMCNFRSPWILEGRPQCQITFCR